VRETLRRLEFGSISITRANGGGLVVSIPQWPSLRVGAVRFRAAVQPLTFRAETPMDEPVRRARSSRDITLATERISTRSDFRRIDGSRRLVRGQRMAAGGSREVGRAPAAARSRMAPWTGRSAAHVGPLRECQKNLVHRFHAPGNVWWGRLQYGREIASEH
jgi:hypothetical protein